VINNRAESFRDFYFIRELPDSRLGNSVSDPVHPAQTLMYKRHTCMENSTLKRIAALACTLNRPRRKSERALRYLKPDRAELIQND
jgi:hypothetical protein